PLISVGVIDAMGTEAIIVRPDAGVKTIADLKGKSLLTTANAGVNTFFPLVLKNGGLSEADVKVTSVPEGALVSSYLQGAGGAGTRGARRDVGRPLLEGQQRQEARTQRGFRLGRHAGPNEEV